MDGSSAAFWLDTITATAVAVWVAGAWFVVATRRRCAEPLRGEQRIELPAADVARALLQQLASGGGNALRHATIDAATDREIRWHAGRPARHTGRITVLPGAGGTRVEWELVRPAGFVVTAMIACAFGALVVVWLHVALRTHVVDHANEQVRTQVVQMVQAVHVLWPPFLFAGLARMLRTQLRLDVERLVANVPFAARAATGRS